MYQRRMTQLLPWHVREALQRAARTPIDPNNPNARANAIDKVLAKARAEFPEYFKKEH